MNELFTHVIRIPGIAEPMRFIADTDEQAQQMACDALGLHFLPDGTVTTQTPSERHACSSAI